MNVCVKVDPIKKSDSEETIRSAISFSSALPPPGYEYTAQSVNDGNIERVETAHLRTALGWSDPRGLFGYSETSEYKDLYVYFDYGDTTSPMNELATKAFKMYGLGGAMVSGKPTWGDIHGPVIIVRLEPAQLSPNEVYNPTFTLEEIYRTIVFFRDADVSAHKIAAKRDSARFIKSQYGNIANKPDGTGYMGPAGVFRTSEKIKHDMSDQCAKCGKAQSLVGRLKKCQVCQKTYYCGKECQRSHWKEHKKVCKTL
jgi:hypothetical protein